MPSKGHLLVADIEYPFEHGEVINYTLDGVSVHPVTTDTGVFPKSVAGEEGNHSGILPLRQMDFKKVTEFNGRDRRKGWINNIVVTPQY